MNRAISVVTLVLLAGLGIGATYLVQHTSAARIATEQRLIDSRTLLDMLPPGSYDNQPLEQPLALENVPLTNSTLLGGYWVTLAGQPSAVLLRSQTLGYTSTIELLIAIDANGKLLGVKTLKQAETPGLGGRLADWPNAWLHIFTGKSRTDPADNGWALKKDQGQFDQMAGATTTSRAVINTVHDALRYFDEHRQQLVGSNAHE
ncbi:MULTISPECIES: RnfABCDGE type electron transport complex subunit G [unclassified Pseudomonas]|uniref:RnfABCDGE type electron transport complex subunit G n=1 Tax=unclassified Pseudomonas TaxID=196821 RepID=UPI00191200F9|nr:MULTISPECIES: RnfABCDGE type electron transport complex subunit G [unclassified Pseudomonas]MBK5552529.1 RnfABCDGE type electron transport complex subunit G [Pseudomonas sp. TH03]MEB0224125.1 RnfABCDGE type electron transport complex subunit G [Pseudomonas sp. 5S1]MEB0297893.1 RnfABCDGE type electron transport complex subunit G [Pseudomonas sp. 10S4]WPX18858.1 RnfABCDGE type electron transport complex subunit G [Pseudomonas sp. 10S4]